MVVFRLRTATSSSSARSSSSSSSSGKGSIGQRSANDGWADTSKPGHCLEDLETWKDPFAAQDNPHIEQSTISAAKPLKMEAKPSHEATQSPEQTRNETAGDQTDYLITRKTDVEFGEAMNTLISRPGAAPLCQEKDTKNFGPETVTAKHGEPSFFVGPAMVFSPTEMSNNSNPDGPTIITASELPPTFRFLTHVFELAQKEKDLRTSNERPVQQRSGKQDQSEPWWQIIVDLREKRNKERRERHRQDMLKNASVNNKTAGEEKLVDAAHEPDSTAQNPGPESSEPTATIKKSKNSKKNKKRRSSKAQSKEESGGSSTIDSNSAMATKELMQASEKAVVKPTLGEDVAANPTEDTKKSMRIRNKKKRSKGSKSQAKRQQYRKKMTQGTLATEDDMPGKDLVHSDHPAESDTKIEFTTQYRQTSSSSYSHNMTDYPFVTDRTVISQILVLDGVEGPTLLNPQEASTTVTKQEHMMSGEPTINTSEETTEVDMVAPSPEDIQMSESHDASIASSTSDTTKPMSPEQCIELDLTTAEDEAVPCHNEVTTHEGNAETNLSPSTASHSDHSGEAESRKNSLDSAKSTTGTEASVTVTKIEANSPLKSDEEVILSSDEHSNESNSARKARSFSVRFIRERTASRSSTMSTSRSGNGSPIRKPASNERSRKASLIQADTIVTTNDKPATEAPKEEGLNLVTKPVLEICTEVTALQSESITTTSQHEVPSAISISECEASPIKIADLTSALQNLSTSETSPSSEPRDGRALIRTSRSDSIRFIRERTASRSSASDSRKGSISRRPSTASALKIQIPIRGINAPALETAPMSLPSTDDSPVQEFPAYEEPVTLSPADKKSPDVLSQEQVIKTPLKSGASVPLSEKRASDESSTQMVSTKTPKSTSPKVQRQINRRARNTNTAIQASAQNNGTQSLKPKATPVVVSAGRPNKNAGQKAVSALTDTQTMPSQTVPVVTVNGEVPFHWQACGMASANRCERPEHLAQRVKPASPGIQNVLGWNTLEMHRQQSWGASNQGGADYALFADWRQSCKAGCIVRGSGVPTHSINWPQGHPVKEIVARLLNIAYFDNRDIDTIKFLYRILRAGIRTMDDGHGTLQSELRWQFWLEFGHDMWAADVGLSPYDPDFEAEWKGEGGIEVLTIESEWYFPVLVAARRHQAPPAPFPAPQPPRGLQVPAVWTGR